MVIRIYSHGFSLLIIPLSITQWRVEIGMFNPAHMTRFINEKSLRVACIYSVFRFGIRFVFLVPMLFGCVDIELNLSLKKKELLLQFLNLPFEFKQYHCTQFCQNRSYPSLFINVRWFFVRILFRCICIF